MKIAPSHNYQASLESVAMTDIVMNLFIFFFISFSLIYTFDPTKEERIKVGLPKEKIEGDASTPAPLVLTITKENLLFLGDRPVEKEQLENEIRTMLAVRQDKTIFLRADSAVNYGFVMNTLARARNSGAQILSLAVDSK